MDKELIQDTIIELREAAETIWRFDYDQWYHTDTKRTHEEWTDEWTREQINSLNALADKLEELE